MLFCWPYTSFIKLTKQNLPPLEHHISFFPPLCYPRTSTRYSWYNLLWLTAACSELFTPTTSAQYFKVCLLTYKSAKSTSSTPDFFFSCLSHPCFLFDYRHTQYLHEVLSKYARFLHLIESVLLTAGKAQVKQMSDGLVPSSVP